MSKVKKVGYPEAVRALETLQRYGAQSFNKNTRPTPSQTLGIALAQVGDGRIGLHEMAAAALEDANNHTSSAVLDALVAGTWTRKGREVTITLPEFWKEIP